MQHSSEVTSDQIDKCHRTVDDATGEVYYQVDSASDVEKVYEVRALLKNGKYFLTCTCPHNGDCWHKRASKVAAHEYHAEQERLAMEISLVKRSQVPGSRHYLYILVQDEVIYPVMHFDNGLYACKCASECVHVGYVKRLEINDLVEAARDLHRAS